MTTVILIIHIIISIAIVGLVLMQRSEGGGLGIGGGNNFMSARGTADFLTRALVKKSAVPLADIKLFPPPMPSPPPSLLCMRTKPTIAIDIIIWIIKITVVIINSWVLIFVFCKIYKLKINIKATLNF